MNEESLEFDLDLEPNEEHINRTQNRIQNLSSKVRQQAEETATERKAREEAEARAVNAEKRAEFLEAFNGVSAKFPAASEHRDAIQEKVMAGYSVEDAAVSVLNAEGKLTPSTETPMQTQETFGGSATTPPIQGETKSAAEMTQEERRALLIEADKRGEVEQALKSF